MEYGSTGMRHWITSNHTIHTLPHTDTREVRSLTLHLYAGSMWNKTEVFKQALSKWEKQYNMSLPPQITSHTIHISHTTHNLHTTHTSQNTPTSHIQANAGNVGNVGNVGNAGIVGNAGYVGNVGNAGNAGNAGNVGNAGNIGNAGIVGNVGNAGIVGNEATCQQITIEPTSLPLTTIAN